MKRNEAILQMFSGLRGVADQIKFGQKYNELLESVIQYDNQIREQLTDQPELLAIYLRAQDSIESLNDETLATYCAEVFRFGFYMGLDIAQSRTEI